MLANFNLIFSIITLNWKRERMVNRFYLIVLKATYQLNNPIHTHIYLNVLCVYKYITKYVFKLKSKCTFTEALCLQANTKFNFACPPINRIIDTQPTSWPATHLKLCTRSYLTSCFHPYLMHGLNSCNQ